jgi:hypothetical protein
MPNENDQKRSVLSNVEVMQKFQMSKGRSERTHTWRWMGLVRRTKMSTTKMVLMTTTLNDALTLERPWLGCKKEKQQDSHTCLSSHSLFWLQACGFFCIFGLWMAHTHTMCELSFFLSLCFCLIGSISFLFLLVHFKTW